MSEKISWRRAMVEALVVVASILLAFGIEASWQERKESKRLEDALLGLEGVLAEHVDLINESLQAIGQRQRLLTVILTADADRAPDLEPDSLMLVFQAVYLPTVFNLNGEELLSLLEAEALQDLDDPALRTASARWRGRWQIVLDRHESLYQHQDAALQALAMHRSIRPALGLTLLELPLGTDALEVALRDDVIVSLATVKLAHLNALTFIYEMQADLAQEVLLATEGLEGR